MAAMLSMPVALLHAEGNKNSIAAVSCEPVTLELISVWRCGRLVSWSTGRVSRVQCEGLICCTVV